MDKVGTKPGTLARVPTKVLPSGQTADEVKFTVGKALAPDVAPLQTKAMENLVSGNRPADTRLDVPTLLNPFASPTGPMPDHIMAKKALTRFRGQSSKEMDQFLQNPPPNTPEQKVSHMRACTMREGKMMAVLDQVVELMDQTNMRVLENQEG